MSDHVTSPFSLANIRLFIAFRMFFNIRLYYPVFTILFLDYGLSIEEFALLNTVWAFTIVLAEVPSGALADILGRKALLVLTSALMVMEMALLAFLPIGNHVVVFSVFFLNRILSGLAEAMASGADEALAYDTLVDQGMAESWPQVLDVQMRVQSIGYIFAMTLGAALYDPGLVNTVLAWLGFTGGVTQEMSMRYPLYLTFLMGLVCVYATLHMRDPGRSSSELKEDKGKQEENTALCQTSGTEEGENKQNIWTALCLTVSAGKWILATPFALAVILFGMALDHVLRMIVTMTSQYYRLIDLPEASFGLVGSLAAIIGVFIPRLARYMVERFSPLTNCLLVIGVSLVALEGLTFFIPWFGILPMLLIFACMTLTSFFLSHYLNDVTASHHRATVLSFKGLALNAAYGGVGIFYALLIQHLRTERTLLAPDLGVQAVENRAFQDSLAWFPWYLVTVLLVVGLVLGGRLVWKRR